MGDVEIVVNNAGAIYPADLLSTKDEEITRTFEVNILGHFWVSESETFLAGLAPLQCWKLIAFTVFGMGKCKVV